MEAIEPVNQAKGGNTMAKPSSEEAAIARVRATLEGAFEAEGWSADDIAYGFLPTLVRECLLKTDTPTDALGFLIEIVGDGFLDEAPKPPEITEDDLE